MTDPETRYYDTPNPDPGYPGQAAMNQNNPDQQQNRGERPHVEFEQDEKVRKADIRKAVEEDAPRQDDDGGLGGGHGG